MPVSLSPTEEDEPAESGRTAGAVKPAPRMTPEQRAGLLGVVLGFILCGIMVWLFWVVYSVMTHAKPVPGARVPLPADEMRETATVTVMFKAFVSSASPDDRVGGLRPEGRVADDQIRIVGEVANNGTRDIRALRGDIKFTDVFGDEIKTVEWTYEHGVRAGERKHYEAKLVYDALIPGDRKLRTTPLAEMKVRWEPQTIVFADGTMLRK